MSTSASRAENHRSHGDFESRGVRPIQPIAPPPRSSAVNRLSERLEADYGHSQAAAKAIAEAVEDPSAARNQLRQLSRVPVRGGTLYTLDVRVNALRVAADPVNPRTVGSTDYPASAPDNARAKYWAPRDLSVDEETSAELHFAAGTRERLIEALDDAKAVLRDQNPLQDSIALNGVFFPLTVMPWIIEMESGDQIAGLFTRDGSSRLVGAQENLGIRPADPLFGDVADPRRSRGIVKELSNLVESAQEDIATADAARAHSLMVPARIIIAYEPDPGSDSTLLDVVDELVALLHLDPPEPWTPPAEGHKRADIVLDELRREKVLDGKQAEYFAGMIDQATAKKQRLPQEPDARAKRILHFFTSQPSTKIGAAIGRGIRLVEGKAQARKEYKTPIIASLALRGHNWTSANQRKSAESTLPRVHGMSAFWDRRWRVTKRDPDELLTQALVDLENGKSYSPTMIELAAVGSYWLVVHGALGRESFGQAGAAPEEKDNRSPSTVLGELLRTERGLRVLHRAVVDGRNSEAPKRIDQTGTPEPDGTGVVPAMTNTWLRSEFKPRKGAGSNSGGQPPTPQPATPSELLEDEMRAIRREVADLANRVGGLRNIIGVGDLPVVDEVGVPMADVTAIEEELRLHVTGPLHRYGAVHAVRQTAQAARPEQEMEAEMAVTTENES